MFSWKSSNLLSGFCIKLKSKAMCFHCRQYCHCGTPGNVRGGLALLVWVWGWPSCWLATPTISAPPYSLPPTYPIGRTDFKSKIVWLNCHPSSYSGSPARSQGIASSVQAMHTPLLRVLARVILIDSWEFPRTNIFKRPSVLVCVYNPRTGEAETSRSLGLADQ